MTNHGFGSFNPWLFGSMYLGRTLGWWENMVEEVFNTTVDRKQRHKGWEEVSGRNFTETFLVSDLLPPART
jgi:hypothetical protein